MVLNHTMITKQSALQYLPVGLFGSTVAIAGLGLALKQSVILYGLPACFGIVITMICWSIFILLSICYMIKCFRFPAQVKAELTNQVTANFLGTFFISVVLLAWLTAPFYLTIARITWFTGAGGSLIFMFILVSRLFKGNLSVLDAVPPTLIPGLTVLNSASAGAYMKFGWLGSDVNIILFALGISYVFTFFVIIMYRLVHRSPVVTFLRPTLLLMCAPFEVGFIAYMTHFTAVDLFGSTIFYFGLFIFIVLFFIVFKKGLPFMVSWWGSCFSASALANAALRYAILSKDLFVKDIAAVILMVLIVLILITVYYTVQRLVTGQLLKDPAIV